MSAHTRLKMDQTGCERRTGGRRQSDDGEDFMEDVMITEDDMMVADEQPEIF